jgi:DNA-directed RNA polymerase specialized sigma24 family protein
LWDPDPEYEAIEARLSLPEAAMKALSELPIADREALNLRVVQERPYAESSTCRRRRRT